MFREKPPHIFNSQISFELGLNEITERGGTSKKQADHDALPRGSVKQEPGGYYPNNGRKDEGACESFPRFLGADGRCKRMFSEKYPSCKPTYIIGNNAQDECR